MGNVESSVSYFENALNLARQHEDSAIIDAIQKVASLVDFSFLRARLLMSVFHHLPFWF